MDSANQGDPLSRVPRAARLLARFPGPVAIAAGPVEGAIAVLGAEEIDGLPWAVEVGYTAAGRHLLTIRTVRSAAGLEPRGLTVESLASAVVNFVARDEAARAPEDRDLPAISEAEQRIMARITASRLTRQEVADAPTHATTLDVAGVAIEGQRVDIAGCSAVDLTWGDQSVYCAGAPHIVDALKLRSATPDDFDADGIR